MHLDIAVAKVRKYAVPESGDTIETIERPGGGISIVVVDGQRCALDCSILPFDANALVGTRDASSSSPSGRPPFDVLVHKVSEDLAVIHASHERMSRSVEAVAVPPPSSS